MNQRLGSERDPSESLGDHVAGLSPAKRALLKERLRLRDAAAATNIARREPGAPAPLSFGQELLWLLDRSMPGSTAYNVPVTIALHGPLDLDILRQTLQRIVDRHDVFRTTFGTLDGEPIAVTADSEQVDLEIVDLVTTDRHVASDVDAEIGDRARRPFDLAEEPAFRASLFVEGPARHVLLLLTHHIAFDGLSAEILLRELAQVYRALSQGSQVEAPAATIDYRDFASWQRSWLSGVRLDRLLSYWRDKLAGVTPLQLPTDRPRSLVQSYHGAQETILIPAETVVELRELGRREGATLYMVLVAAYVSLLHRYSEQDDIVIGSPVAGRTRRETEHVIGYFANILPLRVDVSGDPSFVELLARVRESALGAFEHQDVPLEKLILELRQQELGDTALFRCVLTMQDVGTNDRIDAGTIGFESRALDPSAAQTSKFDLVLLVGESGEGVRFTLQYRTDLFDRETAARLLGHLRRMLQAAVANLQSAISRIPILTDPEVANLDVWNQTRTHETPKSIVASFDSHALAAPERIAVICDTRTLTYGDLSAQSGALAHTLRSAGVRAGQTVGLCLDRSIEMIVGMLGILKAGGAYVPLSPEFGAVRIGRQLADSGSRVVVTSVHLMKLVQADDVKVVCIEDIDASGDTFVGEDCDLEDLAYVLYTSGSSGEPKGVAVTHGNISNYAHAILEILRDDQNPPRGDRSFATVTTLGADLGNTSIFGALVSGATLHVIPSDVATDGPRFAAYLSSNPVDVLKITPSHIAAVIGALGERAGEIMPRQWLVLGGEALHWSLVETLQQLGDSRILNHYGPTETTVGCSVFPVDSSATIPLPATVPIGRPLENVQLHVLDRNQQRVPVGIPGELYVGGAGLARGYVGRPDQTAASFLEIEGLGSVYRTGDRVRRDANGDIEFLGRSDRQVKIRGFRVELGEIEAQLEQHPTIERAAVLLPESASSDARFLAFVTRAASDTDSAVDIENNLSYWLAERLPSHMIPKRIIVVDMFPLNANGKVDFLALSATISEPAVEDLYVAPRTITEETISAIWSEILRRERVGATDDFFELGGDSLLAIRALGRLSRTLGMRISLRALVEASTVEKLAEFITQPNMASGPPLPYLAFHTNTKNAPFFYMHGDLNGGGLYSVRLAEYLGAERPLYVFHPTGMLGGEIPSTIEGIAAEYIGIIKSIQREGPYSLGGYCNGGIVAFEIAQQLRSNGEQISDLILLSSTGSNTRFLPVDAGIRTAAAMVRVEDAEKIGRGFVIHCLNRLDDVWARSVLAYPDPVDRVRYFAGRAIRYAERAYRRAVTRLRRQLPSLPPAETQTGGDRFVEWMYRRMKYVPHRYDGEVTLILGEDELEMFGSDTTLGWGRVVKRLNRRVITGGHSSYLIRHLHETAAAIKESLLPPVTVAERPAKNARN